MHTLSKMRVIIKCPLSRTRRKRRTSRLMRVTSSPREHFRYTKRDKSVKIFRVSSNSSSLIRNQAYSGVAQEL